VSTLKRGPVAALGVVMVVAEVFFYATGGWLLVLAAGATWGGIAYASIQAENRVWGRTKRRRGPCSDPTCFTSHESNDPRCRCRCRGTRCGQGAQHAGRGNRRGLRAKRGGR
jgi:hypothetical protein